MLGEISQTEIDKNCLYHLYVECKKYNKLVNISNKKQTPGIENKLVVTSGEKAEGSSNMR